jgi:EamA domain-containing membrane protein RarD
VDISIESLTLAALLTTAGSTAAAALITGLVSVLSGLVPWVDDGHEVQTAAVIAGVLVLLLAVQAVASGAMTVDVSLLLAVVFGWYAITRLSMAINDDVSREPRSLTNQAATDTQPSPPAEGH